MLEAGLEEGCLRRLSMRLAKSCLAAVVLAILLHSISLSVGEPAPDFALKTIDGEALSLSSFRGRVVVIDFFATWCKPCVQEVPELAKIRQRYSQEQLIMVSLDVDPSEDPDLIRGFREAHGISWPICAYASSVADDYGVKAIPTIVIVDREGRVAYVHVGYATADQLSQAIDAVIAGEEAPKREEVGILPYVVAALLIAAAAIWITRRRSSPS